MIVRMGWMALVCGVIGAGIVNDACAQSNHAAPVPMASTGAAGTNAAALPLPKGWPMPAQYPVPQDLSAARIAYTLEAQQRGDKENYAKAAALIQAADRAKADADSRRNRYQPKAIELAGQRARAHGRSYATPADIQQALTELEAQAQ